MIKVFEDAVVTTKQKNDSVSFKPCLEAILNDVYVKVIDGMLQEKFTKLVICRNEEQISTEHCKSGSYPNVDSFSVIYGDMEHHECVSN